MLLWKCPVSNVSTESEYNVTFIPETYLGRIDGSRLLPNRSLNGELPSAYKN